MKYAIISDIHGNLEALEAVLAEIRRHPVEGCICAGDVVGYGANPRECLKLVRDLNPVIVMGNHDAAACGRTPLDYFNQYARSAAVWTRERLSSPEKSYLASLPLVEKINGLVIVHSSLVYPERWNYILSARDARDTFDRMDRAVCVIGHSHLPVAFLEKEGEIEVKLDSRFILEEETRYIINAGSVGQPRDGDRRAGFALLDTGNMVVEIIRVEYPIQLTQEKILRAGLPEFLASRLSLGQ
jgi:predicted phosphodiesterase